MSLVILDGFDHLTRLREAFLSLRLEKALQNFALEQPFCAGFYSPTALQRVQTFDAVSLHNSFLGGSVPWN